MKPTIVWARYIRSRTDEGPHDVGPFIPSVVVDNTEDLIDQIRKSRCPIKDRDGEKSSTRICDCCGLHLGRDPYKICYAHMKDYCMECACLLSCFNCELMVAKLPPYRKEEKLDDDKVHKIDIIKRYVQRSQRAKRKKILVVDIGGLGSVTEHEKVDVKDFVEHIYQYSNTRKNKSLGGFTKDELAENREAIHNGIFAAFLLLQWEKRPSCKEGVIKKYKKKQLETLIRSHPVPKSPQNPPKRKGTSSESQQKPSKRQRQSSRGSQNKIKPKEEPESKRAPRKQPPPKPRKRKFQAVKSSDSDEEVDQVFNEPRSNPPKAVVSGVVMSPSPASASSNTFGSAQSGIPSQLSIQSSSQSSSQKSSQKSSESSPQPSRQQTPDTSNGVKRFARKSTPESSKRAQRRSKRVTSAVVAVSPAGGKENTSSMRTFGEGPGFSNSEASDDEHIDE